MRGSHSASGREEREVGSAGIKTEEKRKEMERGSFAQPSITFLGFKFIWLHFFFFLKYTAHREGERSRGDGEKERKMERENNMGRERDEDGKGGGE